MMKNLKIRQEHINQKIGNFGQVRMSAELADDLIIKEEIRMMKRRVLCRGCMTYTSTSGSCFC